MSTLEASQLEEQVKDTYGFSIKAVKDGSEFCMLWKDKKTQHRFCGFKHTVTRLFDRRQLRGEAERSKQLLCLKFKACLVSS